MTIQLNQLLLNIVQQKLNIINFMKGRFNVGMLYHLKVSLVYVLVKSLRLSYPVTNTVGAQSMLSDRMYNPLI